MSRVGRVAAIVLAAGSSSRFGSNKLLTDVAGEPLVRRSARRALEAGLSPVITVLGFEAARLAAVLADLDLTVAINPHPENGLPSSLHTGLSSVPEDCAAAVVILADMPLVSSEMTAELVTRFRNGAEPLVISRYGEVQAPPTLYARELFADLGDSAGGGRSVVQAQRRRAAEVHWPPALLADLDCPEDLERLRSLVLG